MLRALRFVIAASLTVGLGASAIAAPSGPAAPTPDASAAAGPRSVPTIVAPQPLPPALVAAFAPRAVHFAHPTLARAELAAVVSAFRAARHGRACRASERLRARLMTEAAAVFYGPDRRQVDIKRFDGFLDAHVRGKAPLFEIVGEVFVPVSAWRRLTLASCLRATSGRRRAQPGGPRAGDVRPLQIALRFGAQAAWLGHDEPLRAAVAAAWLGLDRDPAHIRPLFFPMGTWRATVSALMRALLTDTPAARDAALEAAARQALPSERPMVARVRSLLAAPPTPAMGRAGRGGRR